MTFFYPIRQISNDRILLTPFNLSTHGKAFVDATEGNPDLFMYTPSGPFPTFDAFRAFYESVVEANEGVFWFAIMAKNSPEDDKGVFAGTIALESTSVKDAVTEIWVLDRFHSKYHSANLSQIYILPAFHRTFVASNATGLLLQYVMDPPPNGLGLRRCVWQTHAANEGSRRLATRMGFILEDVQRFQRTLPLGKLGNGFDVSKLPEATGTSLGVSRDSAVFAHYCDEWQEKREEVQRTMDRQS